MKDLAAHPATWARAATDAGLVSGCVFAVSGGGEPAAALAFFFDSATELDQRLSTLLAQLAMQLGRAVERQQADEALRLSEERFRSAFDEGPIGIGMVDLEMRYLRVNQVLCGMLGLRARSCWGRSFLPRPSQGSVIFGATPNDCCVVRLLAIATKPG